MQLWIRSQDKTILVNVEYILLNVLDETEIRGKGFILGEYKSKERALEVLDEIQNAILFSSASLEEMETYKINFESWYANNTKTGLAIYQMPKE